MKVLTFPPARDDLPWTGERFLVGRTGEIEFEHYHRYLFATQFCRGRDVLDIASGEGYGSFVLSQVARRVSGVDIDAASIEHANRTYGSETLTFIEGSCSKMPIPTGSIDVVVSFETIEHIYDHEGFLSEIRRVLREKGLLIVSTPDRQYYANPVEPNPFHLLELSKPEFSHLLSQHFSDVTIGVQKATSGSIILPSAPVTIDTEVFLRTGVSTFETNETVGHAPFLIAIASNSALPRIHWGLLDDPQYLETLREQRQKAEQRLNEARANHGYQIALRDRQAAKVQRQLDVAERRLNSYDTREDLLADRRLLELSDIFDASAYRAIAGIPLEVDAAEHYLVEGWRRGLEPGPHFESRFLYPYYCSAGFTGPPALTYLMLRTSGPAAYRTRGEADAAASVVRSSGYFDAAGYARGFAGMSGLDPALHYVLVGEWLGYAPSAAFDPQYYSERNPDVAVNAPSPLVHYLLHGRHEARSPTASASRITFDLSRLDPTRQSVLLISHEASRTGAPILAYNVALRLREKYNVVALLLRGGDLVEDFQTCCAAVIGPLTYVEWHPVEAKYIMRRLLDACQFTYSIANSIESRNFLPWIPRAFVPVISLVHEFASYTRPKDSMIEALDWATELVFSAELTAASAKAVHPGLLARTIHVLPQGRCDLPPVETRETSSEDTAKLRRSIRPEGAEDALIVLGAGFVHIRKGVDLFIACAVAVKALKPKRMVRFVWIGRGYDPTHDVAYSCYLAEQIARSGLDDHFEILDEVADLESVYAETDVFFLSSRLDPLPNVTIDAACCGIPVVCFDGATGIAEILNAEAATRSCVVPYVDADAAARVIADLADDETRRADISAVLRRVAAATFNMDRYVAQLDKLGIAAVGRMRQQALDLATLDEDPTFDPAVFLRAGSAAGSRQEAIIEYLGYWSAVGLSPHASQNASFRRPCAGFHPQIYARENAGRYGSLVNPFADYVRNAKPAGPWCHDLILPPVEPAMPTKGLRIGLHSHFYYPELVADLLDKLAANESRCDLLLTTGDEAKATVLRGATSAYAGGEVVIRTVPNRGRDIGAFLTVFGDDIPRYDVIGHVHGKRSIETDELMGDMWREFLWQNLVGDVYPMFDIIMARFAEDAGLGLVFPEDPHLVGWDGNLDIATDIAGKMGVTEPLPLFFDFPVGTMFWARPAALLPLLSLRLGWDDYPNEPLPYDGTILHALERLVPFSAKQAGYRFAVTHVPGITR